MWHFQPCSHHSIKNQAVTSLSFNNKPQEAPFDPSKPNNLGLRDANLAPINNQWTAEQLGDYYQSTAQPITTWTTLIMEYKNAAQEY
jgi:hypothetical protein